MIYASHCGIDGGLNGTCEGSRTFHDPASSSLHLLKICGIGLDDVTRSTLNDDDDLPRNNVNENFSHFISYYVIFYSISEV